MKRDVNWSETIARNGVLSSMLRGYEQINSIPNSGTFSQVYCYEKIGHPENRLALKCFDPTKFDTDLGARYENVKHVVSLPNLREYLCTVRFVPCTTDIGLDSAVLVMDWVDGCPLGNYIVRNKEDGNRISHLITDFLNLSKALSEAGVCHGDIQCDNIIIDKNGNIRLIDYDGMITREMRKMGITNRELGHPDFQHPRREEVEDDIPENLDDFSFWSILLSLCILRQKPEIIDKYGMALGDGLVFGINDYMAIHSPSHNGQRALIWELIWSEDMGIATMARAMARLIIEYPAIPSPAKAIRLSIDSLPNFSAKYASGIDNDVLKKKYAEKGTPPPPPPPQPHITTIGDVVERLRCGNTREAESMANILLQIQPNEIRLRYLHGYALAHQLDEGSKWEDAESEFNLVERNSSKDRLLAANANFQMAMLQIKLAKRGRQNFGEAIKSLQRAVAYLPSSPLLKYRLSKAMMKDQGWRSMATLGRLSYIADAKGLAGEAHVLIAGASNPEEDPLNQGECVVEKKCATLEEVRVLLGSIDLILEEEFANLE